MNTNNNNRTLTGFWIESSLTISPKEQVEVMERLVEFVDLLDHPVADKTLGKRERLLAERRKARSDYQMDKRGTAPIKEKHSCRKIN